MTAKKNTKKAATTKAKKKPKADAPKKLSALDAAARVLAENGGSMTTKELIETMAAQKLWESPNGKTPAATLYAAILREVTTKGKDSRFKKTEPGKFAATAAASKTEVIDEPTKVEKPAKPKKAKATKGAKKTKATEPPTMIPDGTDGPESMKELFRIA